MAQPEPDRERIRALAESLDCFTEEEVCAMSGWTPGTAKTKRKRGEGPPVIRFGRHYYYPRAKLAEWLQARIRERAGVPVKGML